MSTLLSQSQNTDHDLPEHSEELFHLEQFPLLNPEKALEHCGNHAILIELLTLMVSQELPADLEHIKNAFQRQNFAAVEKIAHKIKGGAIYVGTIRMQYACQYLERYWKTGERALLDDLYRQTINVIEETLAYLNDWLKRAI